MTYAPEPGTSARSGMSYGDPLLEELSVGLDPEDDRIAGLAEQLESRAAEEDLVDVGYAVVDSPIGPLLVAATREGVVRLAFEREGHDAVLEELAARVSPRVLEAPGRTSHVSREIDEYFAGRRKDFDLSVDMRLVTGFRRSVLDRLRAIPFGSTASYATVAGSVGNPKAVRAVGSACAGNPVPLIVPCHRVVRSDGTVGHYRGGTDAKHTLLELESAAARS